MKKPIKVLQLQPSYNVKSNDVSDLAEQIVKSLLCDHYEVTSAYFSGKPKPEQPKSIANYVHYFNLSENDMHGMRLKVLWKLYWFCRANKFDVVICNRFKTVSPMLQLNKLLKIPLCVGISHVMNEYDRKYRKLQIRFLTDKKWKFVGVSDAVRDRLINYKCGFNQKNTFTITNAIDSKKLVTLMLPKSEARLKLNLPLNVKIIGAIGRLVKVKGHEYLIKAFANIENKYPDTILTIIGDGNEKEILIKLINDLNISHKVFLLGAKENAAHYIKAFDIFTMPSIQEGLGLALLEGMCGNLPIIASDIPAMHPLIIGSGGIAVPPKDIASLTQALEAYLSLDASTLNAKGEQVYNYLVKNHSIEAYRSAYKNLIEPLFKVR